jgi:signal transduction histidine kinase
VTRELGCHLSTNDCETDGCCTRPFERTEAFSDRLIAVLGSLNSSLASGVAFCALFDTLLSNILELTESPSGYIGEVLQKNGQPYLRTLAVSNAAWEDVPPAAGDSQNGLEFTPLKTLFGRVLTRKVTIIAHQSAAGQAMDEPHAEQHAVRAFLGIPLFMGHNLIGILGLANRPGGYDTQLAANLRPLHCAAAAMIEAARINHLRSCQAQLVHTEKMAAVGILTAGIAHEINNPANFAHAGAQVLGSDLEQFRTFLLALADEDADDAIIHSINGYIDKFVSQARTIVEGTVRIRDLVRDLRTFSRLDEAELKAVAITDNLMSTVQLVRTQFIHVVDIRCKFAANPILECRPAQLNQVFMNLIINACQAIQSKLRRSGSKVPGVLEIRSRTKGRHLILEFEDNGCGIPQSVVGRIFEPFYTTKGIGEGSGLGLAISFGIIQQHQGSIRVHSVDGQGTCFTVKLPLRP